MTEPLFAGEGELLGTPPGAPRWEDLPSCEHCSGTGKDRAALAAFNAGARVLPPARQVVLDVFVIGAATTAGSIRAINHKTTGRAVAIKSNNNAQAKWRADVQRMVGDHWHREPIDGPVSVHLDWVLPRPASEPKRTRPASRKPDGDKLERAVWDALTHLVYRDDARVVSWSGNKRTAELGEVPGCNIRVMAE